jgi:proteasome beta subunit
MRLDELKVLKGTTTVGLVGPSFVVLAADKRATSGYFIASKDVRKILEVDRHAAVTVAGTVGDAQQLVERLRAEARYYSTVVGEPMPIKSIATLASLILFSYRPLLAVEMLVGGVDSEGPALYLVDLLGSTTLEKYAATGSGSPFAVSVLENEYRSDLSIDETVKIAAKAVRTALSRDPGSGEGVDVAVISKEGIKYLRA